MSETAALAICPGCVRVPAGLEVVVQPLGASALIVTASLLGWFANSDAVTSAPELPFCMTRVTAAVETETAGPTMRGCGSGKGDFNGRFDLTGVSLPRVGCACA